MRSTKFIFKGKDGKEIASHKWLPDSTPRAIVQIIHGVVEHKERYADFATELAANGVGAYAEDHRGHGETAGSVDSLGSFADEGGWDLVVDDIYRLTERIRSEFPKVPVFLLGHSMGSFLARSYIALHGSGLAGAILSATAASPGLAGVIGGMLGRREVRKHGSATKSPKLDKMAFGAYNSRIKPHRTDYDWISRDTIVVDRYVSDPYCGYVPSAGLFVDLLSGLISVNRPDLIAKTPKNLPLLFFSGEMDPVGGYGKGVRKVVAAYKRAGVADITFHLYEDCRHECLNELNHAEVYRDVIDWLNARIAERASSSR